MSPTLRTFFAPSNESALDPKAAAKAKSAALSAKLAEIRRWHQVWKQVGWVGIMLSYGIESTWFNRLSEISFRQFLSVLVNSRPNMIETLEETWAGFPPFLGELGRTLHCFVKVDSSRYAGFIEIIADLYDYP